MSKRLSKIEKFLIVLDGLFSEIDDFLEITRTYRLTKRLTRWPQEHLYHAIARACQQGYLEKVEKEGKKYVRFLPKGRLKILGKKKKPQDTWDGNWRILVFDIEEKRKETRDLFRLKLGELGFQSLQKSVWINPYDVSEEVEELLDLLNLEDNVEYFVAHAVTNDTNLKSRFELS